MKLVQISENYCHPRDECQIGAVESVTAIHKQSLKRQHGDKSNKGTGKVEMGAVFLCLLGQGHACLPFWGCQKLFWPTTHVVLCVNIEKKSLEKNQKTEISQEINKESQTTLKVWGDKVEYMAHTGEWSLCTVGPQQDPDTPHFTWAVAGAVAVCEAQGSFCWSFTPPPPLTSCDLRWVT